MVLPCYQDSVSFITSSAGSPQTGPLLLLSSLVPLLYPGNSYHMFSYQFCFCSSHFLVLSAYPSVYSFMTQLSRPVNPFLHIRAVTLLLLMLSFLQKLS